MANSLVRHHNKQISKSYCIISDNQSSHENKESINATRLRDVKLT